MPRLNTKQLAEIRARRGPLSDPREGRLLREIESAFTDGNEVLTTSVLLERCYGARVIRKLEAEVRGLKTLPSWHRANVARAAAKICRPMGRSTTGTGRPMLWKLDPERMNLR